MARLIVTCFAKHRPRMYTALPQEDQTDSKKKDVDSFNNTIKNGSFIPDLTNALKASTNPPLHLGPICHIKAFNKHIHQLTYTISPPLPSFSHLRRTPPFTTFETTHSLEIIYDTIPISGPISPSSPSHCPIKLALFDMDSTLINEEVIDELARSIGKTDIVSAITASAMNGDIDFATSLQRRVEMLRGVRDDVWEVLKRTVTVAEGARELIQGLKQRGVRCGVVSGGFIPMAEWLAEELGLEWAVANHVGSSSTISTLSIPHPSCLLR